MAEVEESDDKSDGPGTPRSRQLVFSEMPTPAKTPVSTEMDSAERESLKLAMELANEEESYLAAQRQGAARLAELEAAAAAAARRGGEESGESGEEEEEEEDDEEIDESLALAYRLQQEEDDRALLYALNGGQDSSSVLPRNVSPSQMTYDELTQLGENLGKVSKGTSKTALDELPTCTYAQVAEKNAITGEQCAICRFEYEKDDVLRILPCNHAEHAECLDQWLLRNRSCPLCSKDVAPRHCTPNSK